MAEIKLIIPQGQSIRFTPVTYYQQPTGSAFTSIESPQHRNYYNTQHLLEVDSNEKFAINQYRLSYGSRSNYQVQQFRRGDLLWLFYRSQIDINTHNTVKAYSLAGTLLHTFTALGTNQYNDAAYALEYSNVVLSGDGTYTYVITSDCHLPFNGVVSSVKSYSISI